MLQPIKRYLALGSIIVVLVLVLTGCGNQLSQAEEIPIKPDYSLIPVYTLDGRSVYLNASVTPLEFFSVNCSHCEKDIPDIQSMMNNLKMRKPLIYVSTFLPTSNLQEAIQKTKDFIAKYKVTGTVVIQAGDPHEYVKAVPSLVTMKPGPTSIPDLLEGMPTKDKLEAALALPTTNTLTPERRNSKTPIKKG